jgi:DNA polymerase I-like protein with 3'-5' exonuclease and polymerase domains
LVSRRWSYAARQALLLAWRKGACTEWRLLGDLMQNREITKAGLHIKSQLVALRERDVVVEGPLEDPAVAQTLLRQCGGVDGKHSPLSVEIPQLSAFRSDPLKTGQKIACFRAVAVFRAASQVSARLSAVSLLPLYRNIEMALLYCAADAEHCGIVLDAGRFSKLRQDLTLRLQLIEQYFASLFGEDFNLASPAHVAQLKRGLLEECRRMTEAACQASVPAVEQLQVSAAVLDRHPVVRLVSEHRAHVRLLPLCTSVLASRRLDRVRSHYNTLGTETGRVILTHPPLQQVS